MKNYTQELKKYWHAADLQFIATLNKINKDQGFFNHFTNPISKMKLFYPILDDIDIVDKRVSFFHGEASNLTDGEYYKVELDYTNNPKGKNNPYSLKIINISPLDQDKIKKLLEESRKNVSENDTYYGCYRKQNETFASFENVMHSESGEIFMRDGESQIVFVSPKLPLQEDTYYSFSIRENQGKLPNAVPSSITELKNNPYQDHIQLRFERLNNPEANKIIANLMREIGKGMYSSKQRMIFELLQNADDAPGKEKVEFHIDINNDYFFVMHDGAPFSKKDVEAITSAAESTKRNEKKKTGYKGIGFKSVFTDSTEVWIKSGGYLFAFLRNSSYFDNFDRFYFSSGDYIEFPQLIDRHKEKYKNDRLNFNSSTDIPWQVIPIWQNNLPDEFQNTNYNEFPNPVQFALKVGKNNINSEDGYKKAIDNIAKRPQFLLFLRNTTKFRSPKNGVTIQLKENNDVIEITKSKVELINSERVQQIDVYNYTKQIFENIDVSDEAFEESSIGLKVKFKLNDLNEQEYFFTNLEDTLIDTIPPKLASSNKTEISFGIALVNNKISPEKEYIQGLPKYSSLFTYLPMEDTRFQLPFLVNANFVPSSDRQKIQGDNLWNKYLIKKVAEMHVATLCLYANKFLKDQEVYESYLSLLLKNTLPEDDTAQSLIDSFNEKYIKQLTIEPIIVNDRNQTQLLSQTIVDDSGLIGLFGHEIFYQIIGTPKRLPNSKLDASVLKEYKYLNVQVVDLKDLAINITPELCEQIGKVIADRSLYDKPELLRWLNKLELYLPENFGKIPFIVHNNALFSLERLFSETEAWIINKNTKDYETLFRGIGYHTINLQLEKYTNINNYLLSINGYINDKSLAYERIASNPNLAHLAISLKIRLIDFLQNSEFMVGLEGNKYFGELKLFVDEKRIPRPLRLLVGRQDISEISSLNRFRIEEQEYNSLAAQARLELIQKDKVFTSFVFNKNLFNEWSLQFNSLNIDQYVQDLKLIFSWKDKNEEILQSQWSSIPWLFIDDELRFTASDKVLWSAAFNQMSIEKYKCLTDIFHRFKLKKLPLKECGSLVGSFTLNTDSILISDWTLIKDLDTISANILLDWMEVDGTYNSFFEDYTISISDGGKWSIASLKNAQVFDGSENSFKEYINSIPLLKNKFTELDSVLSSKNRHKIGLLQGDTLLVAVIESKSYDQKLATLLQQNISIKLIDSFISNLPVFELKDESEYSINSPEHIVLNSLIKSIEDVNEVPKEVQKSIDCIREKIVINQKPLSYYDLSDTIQFAKGDEKKTLRLSSVLAEFKGESDVLDNLIESFGAIKEKSKLRKLIFKTRRMPFDEICSKIETETSSYYSVNQVVFQLLYQKHIGKKTWSKPRFVEHWRNAADVTQLQQSYKAFLDMLLDLDFTEIQNSNFQDLELKHCMDKNFAIESEHLPPWLVEWVQLDQDKRLNFISKLGYNHSNTPIVKLRKAAVSDNFEENIVIRYFEEAKNNGQLLWNTITWLSGYSTKKITSNINLIKLINNLVTLNKDNLKTIIIPIIESISKDGTRTYKLQAIATTSKLYKIDSEEELAYSIFHILKKEDEELLFIDGSCGKQSVHFNTEMIALEERVDDKLLEKDSKLWEAPFYKKWEYYAKHPIFIYKGNEIPYKQTFRDFTINQFTKDLKVECGGKYYVSHILTNDVLNNLPISFPKDGLISLKEWHYKTLQNDSLLDEDSFEYKENIDRLLQDRLGISQEDQKRESGNAKTHVVYFLNEEGYDVSNVNNAGAALTNIIDPEGKRVNCIVRSAKGGLLYLDKEHWDMLEDENTYLAVIYPGNSPRLFKDRLTLLEEELSENILFRFSNTKQIAEIDGAFNALASESHLILVTSEKMKENLFSKLKQKNSLNKETDVAIKGDNFSFD